MLCRVNVKELDLYPEIRELGGGLTMRKATPEDLLQAIKDSPEHFDTAFVDGVLERGDICVGAFDGEHMVAWAWASFCIAPHGDGLWVKIAPPYSYGYKWFTKPKYRGRDIIGKLTELRDKLTAEAGPTHHVGFTETHSYASLTSSSRLGTRCVGHAGYFKLFGKAYPFRTPGAVKHTFRFVRA